MTLAWKLVLVCLTAFGVIAGAAAADGGKKAAEAPMIEKIVRTNGEWRKLLTPEQYRILREKGTERAFSGLYHDSKGTGVYVCAACGLELFSSAAKYDSGTGWPSFWQPIAGHVATKKDVSFFMVRTEVLCARCESHLGHVFNDGPPPTGLRYCMNSLALKFVEKPK